MTFHFIRPWWLLLLIPAVVLLWQLTRVHLSHSNWQRACDPNLLTRLLVQVSGKRQQWPLLLLALAWLLGVLAMAGPSWRRVLLPVYQQQSAQVIVLDMSPAMLAQDLTPTRFQRAVFKAHDLMRQVKDGQLGLVVFSYYGHVVSPLTHDARTIEAMINELSPAIMPRPGANLADGLQQALQLVQQAGVTNANIIALTATEPDSQAKQAAAAIAKAGYHLNIVGMATAKGAPIPSARGGFESNVQGNIIVSKLPALALAQLAQTGNGRYMAFKVGQSDAALLTESLRARNEVTKTQRAGEQWQDEGRWLILPMLLLALVVFRRGWLHEVMG